MSTGAGGVVAVVPARGGSKGIPRKNLRLLDDVPLVAHAVRQARSARRVDRVLVTTDDPQIAEVARTAGAEVPFVRPAELATDDASDLGVFAHLLDFLERTEGYLPELLVHVRATSPVRRPQVIDLAVDLLRARPEADSLRTVSRVDFTPYKMWQLDNGGVLSAILPSPGVPDWYDQPRQALPEVFQQDGLVDVVRPRTVLAGSMAGRVVLGMTHADPAVDIDDLAALNRAATLMPRCGEPSLRGVAIVQGRMVASRTGALQSFPGARWEEEFSLARAIGLHGIELLVDRRDIDNPLWTPSGRAALAAAARRSGVGTPSACIDDVMMHDVTHPETVHWLAELLPKLAALEVGVVVLPLFGASELLAHGETDAVVRALRSIADGCARAGSTLCLETSLPGPQLYQFLGRLGHSAVRVCYDTGNTTALGHRTAEDVDLLGPSIGHVHIKDKDADGTNVSLGTGRAQLSAIFAALARTGYQGLATLETPRGDDPLSAAQQHRQQVLDLWTGGTE